jgi:nitrite reductase/ring-hydroxylating ferredoxin subunit
VELPDRIASLSDLYNITRIRYITFTMATNLLHYFTFGAPPPSAASTPEKEKPVRALPASWYTSPVMFSLERRAIFSRRWLFLTHSSRLKSPGDWLRYHITGFDIILLKDRTGTINAFHNVCRHRAHPVIDKEGGSGNSRILACRYHGWSYGLDGKLAKAPGYQGLEFDKEVNGLFGIHVRVDRNGFVWVNMDAGEVPEVSFEEYFENVDVQQRYIDSGIEFGDYELDHVYEIEGKMPLFLSYVSRHGWCCPMFPHSHPLQAISTGKSSQITSTNATTAPQHTQTSPRSSISKLSTPRSKTDTSSTTANRQTSR